MKLAVFVSLLAVIPFQAEAASCIGRRVEVWVANGFGLRGDAFKEPDPYVVVTLGNRSQKTRVIHTNSNPSWFQRFTFYSPSTDFMKVDVWDKDSGLSGDDDHQGTCVEQLSAGGKQFKRIQCNLEDGSIKLFYKCT